MLSLFDSEQGCQWTSLVVCSSNAGSESGTVIVFHMQIHPRLLSRALISTSSEGFVLLMHFISITNTCVLLL